MPTMPGFPHFDRNLHAIRNLNEIVEERSSVGEKAADRVAGIVGSWRFIIVQSFILMIWVIVNVTGIILAWDPYPFILMNLVLSTQAAFTAPIIMMSQNRQATIDRIEAHQDYLVNQKSAADLDIILKQLDAQNQALVEIHRLIVEKGLRSEE